MTAATDGSVPGPIVGLPVTMDQLIPMVQAVVRGTRTALVVADLPFGSYQARSAHPATLLAHQRHPGVMLGNQRTSGDSGTARPTDGPAPR